MTGFGDVELAIEAVPERLELKLDVFAELDAATPGHAILASATSALSIADLAAATARPDRVLGLHFFHPRRVERASSRSSRRSRPRPRRSPPRRASWRPCARARSARRTPPASSSTASSSPRPASSGTPSASRTLDPPAIDRRARSPSKAARDRRLRAGRAARPPRRTAGRWRGRLRRAPTASASTGHRSDLHAGASGDLDAADDRLAALRAARASSECCLLLEEGVAGAREIDLALAAGGGLARRRSPAPTPPAWSRRLARLEHAAAQWGEAFAPPLILRRLVAQGRLGAAAGQGFFPSPGPTRARTGPVKLESRGEVAIAWLDNPPANSISSSSSTRSSALWAAVGAERGRGARW